MDAFQIDIANRIVISERLSTDDFPAVAALFPEAREIRFFTNHIATRTRGIDLVANYLKSFDGGHSLDLGLAATFNRTDVARQKKTPAELLSGSSNQSARLLGKTATELIEVAQPRQKVLAVVTYQISDIVLSGRVTHFGNVKAYSAGLSGEDPNVTCDQNNRCVQTFGAKQLVDLSLTYVFTDDFAVTVGGNNIFDVYPDKYNNYADGFVGQARSYANGQIPYSRNSNQFGFNGAYYYVTFRANT